MAKQKLPDLLAPSFVPRMPTSVKDTGLGLGLLVDLTMKFMYYEGNLTGYELSDRLRLPYSGVIDQVLDFLKREKLVEVKGTGGFAESAFQYAISEKGRATAREALERSQYAGPAPVTLQAYTEGFRRQPLVDVVVHPRTMRQALAHLVINEDTFARLGPAVNSGRSLFLFGHPGNGKTAIAESIGEMLLSEAIYVPYAIAIGGQIVRVYDSVNHKLADQSGSMDKEDSRWVRI